MKTETLTYSFVPQEGGMAEYHLLFKASPSLLFEEQLDAILEASREASRGRSVHFRRFFLSDAANQAPLLEKALETMPGVPTSVVQQAPLDGSKIALWLYCTSPMENGSHNGYTHYWEGSMVSEGQDSHAQMSGIFGELDARLDARGLSVAQNTVRTWIFVRDVDVNYGGVVSGRREYFGRIALTPSTHFIASTGIEGRHPVPRNLVEMDAYSIGGLKEGQVGYLYALDHLSPTYDYGVTFERGSMVQYGDRRHIFISGTASIDARGEVMHVGDVQAQTGRMLENISALLKEADAGFQDIAMAIVYLRDLADAPRVKAIISQRCPSLHALYVLGPVCRPAWLVEMECIALTPAVDARYPKF